MTVIDLQSEPQQHPSILTLKSGEQWFMEQGQLWPGQAQCLRVKQVLHREQSLFQDLLVFESTDYGRVLVLDGVIQCTERDEFSYQEMISHLPLNAHPEPRRVLVIGGGDGGVLREVVKHTSVEEVVLCEIDEAVIRVSQQYLPAMSTGFESDNVTVHIGDGFEYLKNVEENQRFDVIITDSSDPVGPASSLFQPEFFELLNRALNPNGIICSQGECQWLHLDIIKSVLTKVKNIFPLVEYAYTTIPTYPSGQIGFILCSKGGDSVKDLRRVNPLKSVNGSGVPADVLNQLRYYTFKIHEASFVLPQFTSKVINSILYPNAAAR